MRKFKNLQYLFLSVFLLLSFCFPQMAQAAEANVPTDIEGHWAAKQITEWTSRSPVGVYPDGTFKPDNNITRAEFTALVNWAFGYTKTSPISFSDVFETDSYYTDIARAAAVGYMGGYPDGTMKPNNPLTRQEAAAILMKILHPVNTGSTLTFIDEIPQWCADSIYAVVSNGYMSGYPDKTFRPMSMITRAESISMIARAMGTLYNQAGTYGSAEETTIIPGHVTVSQSGVTLKNMVINGNLYLTEGIGDGHVTLENVQVKGTTRVSGGGENSIVLINSSIGTIRIDVLDNRKVRLVASGTTATGAVDATSPCKLEEEDLTGDGFGEVVINIPEGAKVELIGAFQTISVESANAQVDLMSGSIQNFIIAPASSGASINFAQGTTVNTFTTYSSATVTGDGTIQTANINANGVSIAKAPVNTVIAEGLTALIAGKEKTGEVAGAPVFSGGGSGGSSKKKSNNAAPDFVTGYPKIDKASVGTNSVTVLVLTNKQGTAYCVALPDGAVAPTALQVKEGKDSNGTVLADNLSESGALLPSNNEITDITFMGLTPNKAYDIYVVAEDQNGKLQATATKLDVTTKAIAVSGITIDPAVMTLIAGETKQITATVEPGDASNKKVNWSSDNEEVAIVDENGVVTAVAPGKATITSVSDDDNSKQDSCIVTVYAAGTIKKTAFWGTPDNVLYYFEFELGNGLKIGNLTSLVAKAYDGDTLLSTISLKEEKFIEYAEKTFLGGSFRSNPEASPSSSWNLEAFDGTMPTKIIVSFVTGGNTCEFGLDAITWINEGYKKISNTTQKKGYDTIQAALAEVKDGDEILVAAGTYELDQKLSINNKITISGKGEVILSVSSDLGIDNSSKHAIGIYSDNVTLNNFTIENNNKAYGVQAYKVTGVKLNGITINNSKGAGLTVNGSNVTATNLSTSGNSWGAVNVDPGSGVILPSSFTLEGQSELKEDTQIWSDGKNVSDAATVTVNAQGYDEYYIGESNNSKKWTNKELRNVAIINKDKKVIYQTIQGAIDNAVEQDEILVAPGTYDVTYVNGNTKHYLWVNKSVTLMAADMEEKPILTADFKQVNSQAGGQQQTVFVTADNVTLDGLIVYSITDYPTSYTKVIEIENANCAVIKNCKLYDEGRTAIYLGGTKVGKYTIEDNILFCIRLTVKGK